MTNKIKSFKTKVVNKCIITPDGREYAKTVYVSFYDEFGNEKLSKSYGLISNHDIFDKISNNEDLNLSYCYIEDFSISDYKILKSIPQKNYVNIYNLDFSNSFINSTGKIDFSFVRFEGSHFSFKNSYIGYGAIDFNHSIFECNKTDFGYCHFGNGDAIFSNSEFNCSDFNINSAIFGSGTKDFQYAKFHNDNSSFNAVDFGNGDLIFIGTQFKTPKLSFKATMAGDGKKDFHFAKFDCPEIIFERIEFNDGKVDFRNVEWGNGRVNFNRAVFGKGEKIFDGGEFEGTRFLFKRAVFDNGDISFEGVNFKKSELDFERAEFKGNNLTFKDSDILKLDLNSCHINQYLDLRLKRCKLIDLSDAIIRDIVDLTPFKNDVNIDIIKMIGMRKLGTLFLSWEKNKVYDLINNQQSTTLGQKAEQFRILKENFRANGQYDDEDLAYVEFKRFDEKAKLELALKENKYSAIWEYPLYFFKWVLFDKVGLYATHPVRVLVSMLFAYIGFSMLYVILPEIMHTSIESSLNDPDKLGLFAKSFYHSAITFLTIGYGDYYPSGFFRALSSIEGFFGLFLMSYFTVAFVRKILR